MTHLRNLTGRPRHHHTAGAWSPADLFLLDFAITGTASSHGRGGSAAPLEVLVRRLLSLPGGPAVLGSLRARTPFPTHPERSNALPLSALPPPRNGRPNFTPKAAVGTP